MVLLNSLNFLRKIREFREFREFKGFSEIGVSIDNNSLITFNNP